MMTEQNPIPEYWGPDQAPDSSTSIGEPAFPEGAYPSSSSSEMEASEAAPTPLPDLYGEDDAIPPPPPIMKPIETGAENIWGPHRNGTSAESIWGDDDAWNPADILNW